MIISKWPKWYTLLWSLLLYSCREIDEQGALVPPTADQDRQLPQISITVAGKTRAVHLETFGNPNNPPLFVLHGSYTDYRSYRMMNQLSDKYFVVIWDQRGCGLSERISAEEFSFDSAVEEINRIKEVFAPTRPITLVGFSWGGGLAALYTSRFPQNVQQLILGEPMPLRGEDMQQLFSTIIEFSFFNPSWNQMGRMNDVLPPRTHELLDYRAMMMLRSTMSNYFVDRNNPPDWKVWRVGAHLESVRNERLGNPLTGFKYDFSQGLKDFATPVLVIGGSHSALGFEVQQRYVKPLFGNASVVLIEPAGHRFIVEKPDDALRLMKAYLTQYQN